MRMMVMVEGTVIDGIAYKRGTIVNVSSSVADLKAFAPVPIGASNSPLYTIPRLRNTATTTGAGFPDLSTTPPYIGVPVPDQLGRKTSEGDAAPNLGDGPGGAFIVEPVLPTENKQYD